MTRRSFIKAFAVAIAAPTLVGRKLLEIAERVKPVTLIASHDPLWDQMYGMHDVLNNSNTYTGIDRTKFFFEPPLLNRPVLQTGV